MNAARRSMSKPARTTCCWTTAFIIRRTIPPPRAISARRPCARRRIRRFCGRPLPTAASRPSPPTTAASPCSRRTPAGETSRRSPAACPAWRRAASCSIQQAWPRAASRRSRCVRSCPKTPPGSMARTQEQSVRYP